MGTTTMEKPTQVESDSLESGEEQSQVESDPAKEKADQEDLQLETREFNQKKEALTSSYQQAQEMLNTDEVSVLIKKIADRQESGSGVRKGTLGAFEAQIIEIAIGASKIVKAAEKEFMHGRKMTDLSEASEALRPEIDALVVEMTEYDTVAKGLKKGIISDIYEKLFDQIDLKKQGYSQDILRNLVGGSGITNLWRIKLAVRPKVSSNLSGGFSGGGMSSGR